jgi:hypothetical protein
VAAVAFDDDDGAHLDRRSVQTRSPRVIRCAAALARASAADAPYLSNMMSDDQPGASSLAPAHRPSESRGAHE